VGTDKSCLTPQERELERDSFAGFVLKIDRPTKTTSSGDTILNWLTQGMLRHQPDLWEWPSLVSHVKSIHENSYSPAGFVLKVCH